jgi:hypothetical protein
MVTLKSKSGKWALYGDANAQIVVCGHSHAGSILFAKLHGYESDSSQVDISVAYTADLNQGAPGDVEYWNFVSDLSHGKHVFIAWNGNQHNVDFMFQTDPNFTMLGVAEDSNGHESVPIPRAMIKSYFEPSFEDLTRIIPSLSNAASITLMNGPAPKPLSHIQKCIAQEKYFTEIAESLGVVVDDLVVTSDSLRLGLWKLISEMLESYAHSMGLRFLSTPIDSLDGSGLLHEKYWVADTTHANEAYGVLQMERIIQSTEKSQP